METTVPNYSDSEFRQHFRCGRQTILYLINRYKESNFHPKYPSGREKVTEEKAVYLTIWYLANENSFREMADRFNISLSSAHRVLTRVVNFILSLAGEYIRWPNSTEAEETSNYFRKKQGIEGIIGAIDGSHIRINRPAKNQEEYCNRKGFHSVLLQAIVNHRKMFIDVVCGEPGSLHDSRMLKRSSIYHKGQESNLFGKYFLLGDSAYPSLKWLVPPFKDNGNLTENEKLFNYRHSCCRIIIEHAFGLLKQRFRRLKKFYNLDIELIKKCIMAACILHNMCILKNDTAELENDVQDQNRYLNKEDDEQELFDYIELAQIHAGERRREIFNKMFQ